MRLELLTILVCFTIGIFGAPAAPTPPLQCSYSLYLSDTWSDGWSGNTFSCSDGKKLVTLTDTSDGTTTTSGTVATGLSESYTFSIPNGDTCICTYSSTGRWATENTWVIQLLADYAVPMLNGTGVQGQNVIQKFVASCSGTPKQVTTPTYTTPNSATPLFIQLSWASVSSATVYRVYVSTPATATYNALLDTTSLSTQLYMQPNTNYQFAVAALNAYGIGPQSTAIKVTSGSASYCTINVFLISVWDGWYGGSLLVYINNAIAAAYTSNASNTLYYLQVPTGTITIATQYLPGTFPGDDEYQFNYGNQVLYHGGTSSNGPPSTQFTFNCANLQSRAEEILSDTTEAQHPMRSVHLQEAPPTFQSYIDPHFHPIDDLSHEDLLKHYSKDVLINENLPEGVSFLPGRAKHREELLSSARRTGSNSRHRHLQATTCQYDLAMFDWYGDGWQGCWLDIWIIPTGGYNPNYAVSGLPNPVMDSSGNILSVGTEWPNQATWVARMAGPSAARYDFYFLVPAGYWMLYFYVNGSDPNPTDCAYEVVYVLPSGYSVYPAVVMSPAGLTFGLVPGFGQMLAACGCVGLGTNDCVNASRNPCQASFNAPICGTCLLGYQDYNATFSAQQVTLSAQNPCVDINECVQTQFQNPACSGNATCTNGPGNYSCTCNTGYTGNGYICSLIPVNTTVVCPTTRLRKEWFDMSTLERNTWITCVQKLQQNGTYAGFVLKHANYQGYSHGAAPFLVWHRAFLQEWEDSLRSLGGSCQCVTQPYWDWSTCLQDSNCIANFWTNAKDSNGYWQGPGAKETTCFSTAHPFRNFVVPTNNNACVMRGGTTAPSSSIPIPSYTQIMAGFQQVWNSYANVRPTCENWHNNVHVYVGGSMSIVAYSVSDPVFFLHHTFIDQLFAAWEDCLGYSSFGTTAKLTTAYNSNPSLYWDTSSSQSFTSAMPGYSISPAQSFLLSYYNVVYSKSWIQRALSGSNIGWCTNSANLQYLQSFNPQWGVKHLMSNSYAGKRMFQKGGPGGAVGPGKGGPNGPGKAQHGKFQPQASTVQYLSTPYEVMKSLYTQTGNKTQAMASSLAVACAQGEQRTQPNPTPQVMIDMMHMNEACAMGFCTDPCWKLGCGKRDYSSSSGSSSSPASPSSSSASPVSSPSSSSSSVSSPASASSSSTAPPPSTSNRQNVIDPNFVKSNLVIVSYGETS